MRILVDVINAADAIRDAHTKGLNAWLVKRNSPSGHPEIAIEGFEERVHRWLTENKYDDGEYTVIFN